MAEATLEETIALMSQFAGSYTIGALAGAAGIQGGTTLQIEVTELMAQVTSRLGIDMVPEYIPAESGWIAVAGKFITGARTWLTSAARGTVAALSKSPSLTIGAGLIGGALYTAHDWLTMEERVKFKITEETAETLRHAFDGLSKEDRAHAFGVVAGQLGSNVVKTNIMTWGLLAVGAYVIYRVMR